MEETQRIIIKNQDGNEVEANVITFLKDENTNKEYVFYTFDNIDSNDKVDAKIYASMIVENSSGYELLPIESEEEWKRLQEEIINLTQEK